MTVKELIKELEKMNGDLPVVFKDVNWNFNEVGNAKISYIRRKVILE